MLKIIVRVYFMLALGILFFYACTSDQEPIPEDVDLNIELSWISGAEVQSQEDVITGISWALSQLGAILPKGSLNEAIIWRDDNLFKLDLTKMGFNLNAHMAFSTIIKRLKSSDEYQVKESIDIGRFIMLCLNSPFHYYEIVGIPETLSEFKSFYKFTGQKAELVNSSISLVDRLIEIADASKVSEIAYIGGENGNSFINNIVFEPTDFEVFDIMPNGQLRFGIYGSNGRLKASAPKALTIAGKPSKCIWCHEINIQPFFLQNPVRGNTQFLTVEQFNQQQATQMSWLALYRLSLETDLDYNSSTNHERAEELYEEFMEPTLERLMVEWNLSEAEVRRLVENLPTRLHPIYGQVYERKDVDGVGPYAVIRVSDSAREPSIFEPNFF